METPKRKSRKLFLATFLIISIIMHSLNKRPGTHRSHWALARKAFAQDMLKEVWISEERKTRLEPISYTSQGKRPIRSATDRHRYLPYSAKCFSHLRNFVRSFAVSSLEEEPWTKRVLRAGWKESLTSAVVGSMTQHAQ